MREYKRAQPNFAVRTILHTQSTLRAQRQHHARALRVVLVLPPDVFRIMHDKGSQHFVVHVDAEPAQLVHARGCWCLARAVAGLDFDAESRVK